MKNFKGIWLIIYFLSMSWIFAIPYYAPPRWIYVIVFFAFSLIGLFTLPENQKRKPGYAWNWLLAVLAIPTIFVLPGLYKVVALTPILVLGISRLPLPPRVRNRFSFGLSLLAIICIWQFPVEKLYDYFSAKLHVIPVVDNILYYMAKLFQLPASLTDHTLFIQTMRQTEPVLITWEKLGVLPLFYFVFGMMGAVFFLRPARIARTIVGFTLTAFAFMIIRGFFMIALFYTLMFFLPYDSKYNFVTIFWYPVLMAITFLPLPFLLERLTPLSPSSSEAATGSSGERKRQSMLRSPFIPLAAGICLIVGAYGFCDPGTLKSGRILVDTGHSEWERVDKAYDTEWYGLGSGYNYYSIMNFLGHYYDIQYADTALTPEVLDRFDILIIKIPTDTFGDDEILAIREFVKQGGGLFLIGDHTNVFGSSSYMNAITETFGFRYRYDCLFDIQEIFDQVFWIPKTLPHPILRTMPHMRFQTSCSIEPLSPIYSGVIVGNKLKTLDVDYSSDNFYPQVDDTPSMKFGPFVQMIVRHHGRGRIAGFTDSTIFSNFAAFLPGTSELFLNTIDWLNRRNRLNWLNLLMGIVGGFLLFYALIRFIALRGALQYYIAWISTVLIVLSVAILLFEHVNRANYGSISPIETPRMVSFNKVHCSFKLPIYAYDESLFANFSLFYQWILRLGYFPRVDLDGQGVPEGTNLLILIYPNQPISESYLSHIKTYVANGGGLLVMDGAANSNSTSNTILKPFGLQFDTSEKVAMSIFMSPKADSLATLFAPILGWQVSGGAANYLAGNLDVIGATASFGRGSVTALGFARLFSNIFMGHDQSLIPLPVQRDIYQIEFDVIRNLVEVNISAP